MSEMDCKLRLEQIRDELKENPDERGSLLAERKRILRTLRLLSAEGKMWA